jgi:hypothetical protein
VFLQSKASRNQFRAALREKNVMRRYCEVRAATFAVWSRPYNGKKNKGVTGDKPPQQAATGKTLNTSGLM